MKLVLEEGMYLRPVKRDRMKLFGRKDAPARPSAAEEKAADKTGLMSRLARGLSRTRRALGGRIDEILSGRTRLDDDLLDELEEILITADLGVATTMEIIDELEELAGLPDKRRLPGTIG